MPDSGYQNGVVFQKKWSKIDQCDLDCEWGIFMCVCGY